MPCWTVERTKVVLMEKTTDKTILAAGLKAKGYTVYTVGNVVQFSKGGRTGTYDASTGRLTLPEQWNGNDIKTAYSHGIVEAKAEYEGWTVQWTTDDEGNEVALAEREN